MELRRSVRKSTVAARMGCCSTTLLWWMSCWIGLHLTTCSWVAAAVLAGNVTSSANASVAFVNIGSTTVASATTAATTTSTKPTDAVANVTQAPLARSSSGAAVTSGRRWDLNDTGLGSPPRISAVITAQSGDTAFLPCHVPLREEHGVSWVRRRDWYILTADSKVYSKDERFRVSYIDSPDHTWTLLIKYIRKDDEGVYDCQITTRRGVLTQSIELRIVEPQAVLVGSEDVYVGVGSPFTITCVITNTLKPPEYVLWNVDSKPLNFGSLEQQYQQSQAFKSSVGGGHSVTFDPGPPSVSRLSVHSASASDSGRYTCQPSSGLPASTHVHVALGNEMAAIQAADAAGRDGCWRWLLSLVCIFATLFLNSFWYG